jgi:proteic killer suppression protein
MDVEFADKDLDRLETDPSFYAGHSREIVRAFRKVMQVIRAAADERTFYALKSLRYEKLKGDRNHQRSMRLNKQWRLVLEIKPGQAGNIVVVVSVIDYH